MAHQVQPNVERDEQCDGLARQDFEGIFVERAREGGPVAQM